MQALCWALYPSIKIASMSNVDLWEFLVSLPFLPQTHTLKTDVDGFACWSIKGVHVQEQRKNLSTWEAEIFNRFSLNFSPGLVEAEWAWGDSDPIAKGLACLSVEGNGVKWWMRVWMNWKWVCEEENIMAGGTVRIRAPGRSWNWRILYTGINILFHSVLYSKVFQSCILRGRGC